MRWNESLQLGALMNTRGLVEPIALNVSYDVGYGLGILFGKPKYEDLAAPSRS